MSTTNALVAHDRPLVSVVVRTMGREQLPEALESIARQTYPNIEVVVVDARGTGELVLDDHCGRYSLRVESRGSQLLRAAAANAGLDAARGEYVTFLDEDDFIDATHVAGLANALIEHPQYLASYAGLRVYNECDVVAWVYHAHYSREHLFKRNYLNPQSVLFARAVLHQGCRFDQSFDILEDWDFWLQIAQHTAFLRVDAVTGHWRAWIGQSGAGAATNYDGAKIAAAEQRLKQKWAGVAANLTVEINALLRQGLALQNAGNWTAANAMYHEVLRRNPYDANGLNLSGMVELQLGRVDAAIQLLGSAVACAAAVGEAAAGFHYNLGLVLDAAGRANDAQASYLRALELDAQFERARARLSAVTTISKA
jgi:glycosyltransferase involved in cell wall biosynthesis